MELIKPSDSQYFEQSSYDSYDRHSYKIVSKTNESVVVEDWETAQLSWFQKSAFLSHIEVLDKRESKGFK